MSFVTGFCNLGARRCRDAAVQDVFAEIDKLLGRSSLDKKTEMVSSA